MEMESEEKSAVLLGSNGRLAATWAETLVENNYKVFGLGIEENSQNSFVSQESYLQMDLRKTESSQIVQLLNELLPEALVLNSGIDSRPGEGSSRLQDYDMSTWRDIFEVNLIGAVKVLNSVLEMILPPRRIVVIGSMYATSAPIPELYSHYGELGQHKHPAYSSSKSALLSMVRQYASELLKKSVYINVLSPGSIDFGQDSEFKQKMAQKIPLGRLGDATELKSALTFLLDTRNTYFVGQNLVLDGGKNLW